MTTPAGDGQTPHGARKLFDGIDVASNTMKVCLGSKAEVSDGLENVCSGSKPEVRRGCLPRPKLGVNRT